MRSPEDEGHIVVHLEALSSENYQRLKIQQEIENIIAMAATSALTNKILLKELQKLNTAFNGYNQYIDSHIEKAMGYIETSTKIGPAKKRRDVQKESLVRTYLKLNVESKSEGFTSANNIKKKE